MRQVRTQVEIRQGVKVGLLFTPRLYMFKGEQGITFKADTNDLMQVYALYADIMYCAALNLWTLEGREKADAPFNRADFHEFSAMNPQAFGKVLNIALEALTGKSMDAYLAESKKALESGRKSAKTTQANSKKKVSSQLPIIQILKRFLSGDAD